MSGSFFIYLRLYYIHTLTTFELSLILFISDGIKVSLAIRAINKRIMDR